MIMPGSLRARSGLEQGGHQTEQRFYAEREAVNATQMHMKKKKARSETVKMKGPSMLQSQV